MRGIDNLIVDMEQREGSLVQRGDARRYFHSTYLRTTHAVGKAIRDGYFSDGPWVERWDVVFAGMYLDAFEMFESSGRAPGPWQIAFERAATASVPPLRHTLLGMNAHINFDLPQALLAVISEDEFDDPALLARRGGDHERIDAVLASRVRPEDQELKKIEPPGSRTLLDRVLTPFNTAGTRKFLREARRKVWHNAWVLNHARRDGHDALRAWVEELGDLARARVADLARPGQVILRLSATASASSSTEATRTHRAPRPCSS